MNVPTVREDPAASHESCPGLVSPKEVPMMGRTAIACARLTWVRSWAEATIAIEAIS